MRLRPDERLSRPIQSNSATARVQPAEPPLRVCGNGPDKPIDSNATPDGREKNRRTDIKVYANPSS